MLFEVADQAERRVPDARDRGRTESRGVESPLRRRIRSLRAAWRLRSSATPAERAIALCHALLSLRGEVSGGRAAADLLSAYRNLTPPQRDSFFTLLGVSFLPDPNDVLRAAEAYRHAPSSDALMQLNVVAEPHRRELFRRLNLAPGGTEGLIAFRRDLLAGLRAHPEWAGIDADLMHLFRSWFNGGFLLLRRIDWRTSAVILERLIQYEAVHQIQGWDDLHRRLEADRRCYAFFHPALPEEPLIFIEVALTEHMSAHVQPLLDPRAKVLDPQLARHAIFYSITHCQEGLRGVSFGSLLIKQVVEDLQRSFRRVKTFATLSPIPEFRKWLTSLVDESTPGRNQQVSVLLDRLHSLTLKGDGSAGSDDLRDELVRLCAYYLVHARRGRRPFDSVARFHMANGARLQRLNWRADTSDAGLRRAYGLMANYVYDLDDVERNHEAYASRYTVVASREIERLAKQSLLAPQERP